ncbi:MAG TPA: hypothetical protein VFQ48_07470, partial [Pseudonocardiaceae bacterium]|nr:hypothetical protein [Pseudonocardiaceae bacterium]
MKAAHPRFLRPDVRIEPLVTGFRAWPHLLPPHNLACNVLHKHLLALSRASATASETARQEYGALRVRYEDSPARLVELAEQIAA